MAENTLDWLTEKGINEIKEKIFKDTTVDEVIGLSTLLNIKLVCLQNELQAHVGVQIKSHQHVIKEFIDTSVTANQA